jgi:chromate reductase
MMQQPEAYIGGAADLFNAEGALSRDNTREFFVKFMRAYAAWVARNSTHAAGPG